jgi:DNA polymerase (family 10)
VSNQWRSEKLRRPREVVAHYVQVLTEEIADDNPGLEFHFGGSWRRGAPVIGDLDILVITDGLLTPTLLDAGVVLPSVVQWQRLGPRIANGDLLLPESSGWPGPLHIDVWQALPRSRGAMLAFFTGPMELNLVQRRRAKAMGLALSQNGLTDRATGEQLDDGSEEDIYRLLGMPYLTPAERQRWARPR